MQVAVDVLIMNAKTQRQAVNVVFDGWYGRRSQNTNIKEVLLNCKTILWNGPRRGV